MVIVNESKLNAHATKSDSESIHLNNSIVTGILLRPTSKKATVANNVVMITHKHVIICAPLTPTFLPKKPDTTDPNNGKIIIAKYVILKPLQYFKIAKSVAKI